jgi:putative hydrolase of the HAD superfamily
MVKILEIQELGYMKQIIAVLLFTVSLFAEPQAVVFDFGGVMSGTPDRRKVVQFLCDSLHVTHSEFEKANKKRRHASKSGMTDEEFWVAFSKEKGISLPEDWSQQFMAVMKDALGIDHQMYKIVEALKRKNIAVGLLSNVDEHFAKRAKLIGVYAPFDPCLLSCEIGCEKPDPKAYQILLKRLGLPASDVVFIDDKQENIDQARKQGIDAIVFRSPEQIRIELQNRSLLE